MQLEIDLIEHELPDCVYTDLNIPGMDGLEPLAQEESRFPSPGQGNQFRTRASSEPSQARIGSLEKACTFN